MATGGVNRPRDVLHEEQRSSSPLLSPTTRKWLTNYGEVPETATPFHADIYPTLPLDEDVTPSFSTSVYRHANRGRGRGINSRAESEPAIHPFVARPGMISRRPTTSVAEATNITTPRWNNNIAQPTYQGIPSISDALALLKQFRGGMNAFLWLTKFESYTQCRNVNGRNKISLFKLLMADDALEWFLMLNPVLTLDEASLFDAFRRRYGFSESQKWQLETDLYKTLQRDDQTADNYITAMKLQAFQLGVPETQLVKIIAQNLKNATAKLLILDRHCTLIDDVLEIARNCESAKETDRPSSDQIAINDLKLMVKELTQSMSHNTLSTVAQAPCEQESGHRDTQNYIDRPQRYSRPANYSTNQVFQNSNFQPRIQTSPASRPSYQPPQRNATYRPTTPYTGSVDLCVSCGLNHYSDRCPAQGRICYGCQQTGHYRAVCRNQQSPMNYQRR